MREYSGTYFEVRAVNDSYGLIDNYDTIEQARNAAKKARGAEKLNIVRVTWYTELDDGGNFSASVCHRCVAETYDPAKP